VPDPSAAVFHSRNVYPDLVNAWARKAEGTSELCVGIVAAPPLAWNVTVVGSLVEAERMWPSVQVAVARRAFADMPMAGSSTLELVDTWPLATQEALDLGPTSAVPPRFSSTNGKPNLGCGTWFGGMSMIVSSKADGVSVIPISTLGP